MAYRKPSAESLFAQQLVSAAAKAADGPEAEQIVKTSPDAAANTAQAAKSEAKPQAPVAPSLEAAEEDEAEAGTGSGTNTTGKAETEAPAVSAMASWEAGTQALRDSAEITAQDTGRNSPSDADGEKGKSTNGPGRFSFIREPLHNSTVKISGVNADFVKKYAHICRITQTELIYNFVNEDYQQNSEKADLRNLSFEANDHTITKPKERGKMVPLRLTEKLRDFVDDYVLILGISKSTYIDDLVDKHRLSFLQDRDREEGTH